MALTERQARLAWGAHLATLREQAGISRLELARRVGVPAYGGNRVEQYERGQCWPRLIVAVRLAEALEVSLDELYRPVVARCFDFPVTHQRSAYKRPKGPRHAARDGEIRRAVTESGATLQEVGQRYGISRQRVQQILKRED